MCFCLDYQGFYDYWTVHNDLHNSIKMRKVSFAFALFTIMACACASSIKDQLNAEVFSYDTQFEVDG